MQMINCTTVSGKATSATAVHVVISEYQKSKAVVRRFSAIGTDAACVANWWVPRAALTFGLLQNVLAAATTVRIPVDVAAGHVFKGHTLTTNDKLLVMTSTGWRLVAISVVTDVVGQMYCTVTISALGCDIAAGTKSYIVRAADQIAGIPAVGAGSASVEDLLSGDSGTPLLMELVATSNKQILGCAFVEYWG